MTARLKAGSRSLRIHVEGLMKNYTAAAKKKNEWNKRRFANLKGLAKADAEIESLQAYVDMIDVLWRRLLAL